MAQINPYLHFTGNAEEAFLFYKSVFGGEFTKVVKYKDLSQSEEYPIAEEHLEQIMHIILPIGNGNVLMASDAIRQNEHQKFTFGDNFHIAISTESRDEADYIFSGLALNANVEMPIADSPWGAYFGMLKDQFGIQWTVEFDSINNQK